MPRTRLKTKLVHLGLVGAMALVACVWSLFVFGLPAFMAWWFSDPVWSPFMFVFGVVFTVIVSSLAFDFGGD